MDAQSKKMLLNITYYTVIAAMIAFEIFFMITLAGASLATWERVVYYILAAALLIVVIYDIICTLMHKSKRIAGLILYVISIAVVVVSLIVFAINSDSIRLLLDISETFFRLILFSYILNALAVIIFCTGEKVISVENNRLKK